MRATFLPAILLSLVIVASALAQYNPYAQPYVYAPYAGPGGYLAGQAQQMQAYGQVLINQEQARTQREAASQAKLDTKRKAFDQMLYEKALTPTFSEEQKLVKNQTINRLLTSANPTEIADGRTLNFLMPYINELSGKGVMGPPIPVDPEVLQHVSTTTGTQGPNVSLLQPGRGLEWPESLQGPIQMKLDGEITMAVSQVVKGKLDRKLYKTILSDMKDMTKDLKERCFKKEEIDTGQYLEGTRYLDKLEPAVRDLSKPGAKTMLTSNTSPRGSNVPELVYNMTSKGLTFSPCLPGDEGAYQALHSAFVSYINAAQSSAGLKLQLRPDLPTASLQNLNK
jgi:hypothetical protein